LLSLRNDLGLLSEEYDVKARGQVGNFPQAFSHIALVNAAFELEDRGACASVPIVMQSIEFQKSSIAGRHACVTEQIARFRNACASRTILIGVYALADAARPGRPLWARDY
jgi:hypothetical protein